MSIIFALAALVATDGQQERDLRCVTTMLYLTSSVAVEQRANIVAGAMYYIGKIEGRAPTIDLEKEIVRIASDEAALARDLPTSLKRCGTELQTKGADLTAMGQRLQQLGKK